MKAIYKYQLPITEKYTIQLPKEAIIIRVEDVNGLFYLWAIVDTDFELEARNLEFYKTGQLSEARKKFETLQLPK